MRLIRLAERLEEIRRLFHERDTERVRTGADRNPCLQVLVDVVVRRLIVFGKPGLARRRLHREQLHALAIEQELQIVRLAQSLDVLVAIAGEPDLDFVLSIHWKRVGHQRAAARADRQSLDVFFLREVRRSPDGVAAGRAARPPDRYTADLFRRRNVAVHQRRRQIADGHVVEPVA